MLQIEGQQAASRQAQQEKAALSKLEKLQLDQGRRAEDLEKNAAEAEEKVGGTGCSKPLSQPAANTQGNVRKVRSGCPVFKPPGCNLINSAWSW